MNHKITVNNRVIDWQEGMTVNTVLEKMNYTFKMIIVKVNGELVKKDNYKTHTVPLNAEVQVIHLIAGG